MASSPHVRVDVDLRRVRHNAQQIARAVGVPIIAVIKSDAYGLGAAAISETLRDLVDGFCVFSLAEAITIDLWRRTGKPALAIGPPIDRNPDLYLSHHVRPAVSTVAQAAELKGSRPVLAVDTGQQRFACPLDEVPKALVAGESDEAFTHATSLAQVDALLQAVGGKVSRKHAAGSSLLNEPAARLDAVRPGLALYRGAARVSTRLVEARRGQGPAGYSRFVAPYHGVILCGYSNGLRAGPCLVNGRMSRILEVGMQSAFVETESSDTVGTEVVLLGDSLDESQLAREWNTSPHECLLRLANCGQRQYLDD